MELRNAAQHLEEKKNYLIYNFLTILFIISLVMSFLLWYYFWYFVKIWILTILIIILITLIVSNIVIYIQKNKTSKSINNIEKWICWEKEVAYQLNLLQAEYNNFYILNDFQYEIVWNIDHIIICERWIFTVETKNYNNINLDKNKIIYQARHEAWVLHKELSEQKFWISWVTPILCFVWHNIEEYNKIEKIVLPEKIKNVIDKSTNKIETEKIKDIFLYLNSLQQQK